jgi:hypothetical protein
LALVLWSATGAFAQGLPQVQEFEGMIAHADDVDAVLLENLERGRTIYAYAEATSGNFDPFLGLLPGDFVPGSLSGRFDEEVAQATAENRDPLLVVEDFSERNFLAWDDDSGGGFSATFEFEVPADGDYLLILIGSPFSDSFGGYRMQVGLDASLVLLGQASAEGDPFARPDDRFGTDRVAVQEVTGALAPEHPLRVHRLKPFEEGDVLNVFVEATSGDLVPQVTVRAYGTKPVRSANIAGSDRQTSLGYTFGQRDTGYRIEVSALPGTSGDYRLLLGRNAPDVQSGEASAQGETIVYSASDVEVEVNLQQIAGIDQKAENWDAVATLTMRWQDPALAYRADECKCEFQTYTIKDFEAYVTREGLTWPAYTLLNQQNNRWVQNSYVVVYPSGEAFYFERFTTTLQAPDFDFRQFPFDRQQFFIRVQSLFNTSFYRYQATEITNVGVSLGEEEWYLVDDQTEVFDETSSIGNETSNYVYRFFARRYLSFYIFRIFVPMVLIIVVSWITFFMDDYGKRVDATTANLLLFIAFNFTIANDLPRLGYLTFMDTLLVGAFAISVLIVVYNVYLRRMEKAGRETFVHRVDRYMIWLYPLGYALAFAAVTIYFFVFCSPTG